MRTPPPLPPLPKDYGKKPNNEAASPSAGMERSITKTEEAIIMLLGKFKDKPLLKSEIGYFGSNQGWAEALKMDPYILTEKFKEAGLVYLMSAENDLEKMLGAFLTVVSLKEALGRMGCKKTGNKAELASRLVEFNRDEAVRLIPQEACWGITSKGADLVDDYRLQKKSHREELEDRVFELVIDKMHNQASRLIADYNSKQVFPPGFGCSWDDWDSSRDVNILNTIRELTPNVLAGKSIAELEPARIMASLEYLFGSRVSSRLNGIMFARYGISSATEKQVLDLEARSLLSYAYGKVSLDEWTKRSIVFAKVLSCGDDSCVACHAISQHKYSISKIPQLPYDKCTNPAGCRCCYIPA